jgi:hypothetical protein
LPDERLGEELGILLKAGSDLRLPERMAGIHSSLQEEFGQAFHTAPWMSVDALPLNESSKIDRKQSVRILLGQ